MNLIRWRSKNKVSIAQLARLLGLLDNAAGHLSRVERGQVWIGPELALKIYYLTLRKGPEAVTIADHLEAWRKSHAALGAELRRFGRDTTTKESTSGSKKGKRRQEDDGEDEGASD